MTWLRLDDKRALNAKLRKAGLEARGLDEAALCWCAHEASDGFISYEDVDMLVTVHGGDSTHTNRLSEVLVEVGRWERVLGGFLVNDFLEMNPSRDQVQQARADKAAAGRLGGLRSAASRAAQADASSNVQALALADAEAGAAAEMNPRPVPSRPVPSQEPLRGFEQFWEVYPKRDGKRLGKGKCETIWKRLSLEDRRAAWRGAGYYGKACNDGITRAKDPERWLRDRLWVEWQTPAVPDSSRNGNGHRAPAGPRVQEKHHQILTQILGLRATGTPDDLAEADALEATLP